MTGVKSVIMEYLAAQPDDNKIYFLESEKKKRSRSQNSYMWELLTLICEKLQASDKDFNVVGLYRENIRQNGIVRQFKINDEAVKSFICVWEKQGLGWFCEVLDGAGDDMTLINAYYGSSSYNTKQMKKLLDGVIQDADALDIPTLSDAEIALLKLN